MNTFQSMKNCHWLFHNLKKILSAICFSDLIWSNHILSRHNFKPILKPFCIQLNNLFGNFSIDSNILPTSFIVIHFCPSPIRYRFLFAQRVWMDKEESSSKKNQAFKKMSIFTFWGIQLVDLLVGRKCV